MESSQKYRALAARLAQQLWTMESIDDCRDIERTVDQCEDLAEQLGDTPKTPPEDSR
jgi:hypothetical protein